MKTNKGGHKGEKGYVRHQTPSEQFQDELTDDTTTASQTELKVDSKASTATMEGGRMSTRRQRRRGEAMCLEGRGKRKDGAAANAHHRAA